jgi:N-acetylmuramoyl-L-alanine amidase
MHKMLKAVAVLVIASLVLPSPSLLHAAAAKGKKAQAVIDGDTTKDIKVYTFSGDDYFAVKDIAKLFGGRLEWKPVSNKVTLLLNNERLDIFIKSSRAAFGDKKVRMSIPTRYGSDLYVPAVFLESADFAEFAAADTSWSPDAGILTIEHQATIAPPRYYVNTGATKIVIEMLQDLPFDWGQNNGKEIVVSFPRGHIHEGTTTIDNDIVQNIDMQNKGRQAVVTIRLASGAGTIDKKQAGSKLVITVHSALQSAKQILDTQISSDAAAGFAAATEPVAAVAAGKTAAKRKRTIVLDAGHGGDDPGAVGKNGTREKDLNLAIVKELKSLFENDDEDNWNVVLTRTDDTFIPLVERTTLANEKKADLFVSVHCNADWPRSSSGFEIYFLSEKASDAEAAATAMMENAVVELEGKPSKKRARSQELLWSLMVNEFINESAELCGLITGEVKHRIKIESRGVRQAGFYVLRGTEMPAVLVECAFVSNIKEEALLKTKKFQSQMADAIFEGVKQYVSRKDIANAKMKKEAPHE